MNHHQCMPLIVFIHEITKRSFKYIFETSFIMEYEVTIYDDNLWIYVNSEHEPSSFMHPNDHIWTAFTHLCRHIDIDPYVTFSQCYPNDGKLYIHLHKPTLIDFKITNSKIHVEFINGLQGLSESVLEVELNSSMLESFNPSLIAVRPIRRRVMIRDGCVHVNYFEVDPETIMRSNECRFIDKTSSLPSDIIRKYRYPVNPLREKDEIKSMNYYLCKYINKRSSTFDTLLPVIMQFNEHSSDLIIKDGWFIHDDHIRAIGPLFHNDDDFTITIIGSTKDIVSSIMNIDFGDIDFEVSRFSDLSISLDQRAEFIEILKKELIAFRNDSALILNPKWCASIVVIDNGIPLVDFVKKDY